MKTIGTSRKDYVVLMKAYLLPKMERALIKLIGYEADINLGLYSVLTTLLWYYFYRSLNKIHFTIELSDLATLLKEKLKNQKTQLKLDKRWAGEEWNSRWSMGTFNKYS